MNPEVEEFFHRIKFPFNIGYGMTECGPLISYAPWNEFVPTSSGRVLDIMEARIYKENPDDRLGEIQVRGENVMVGYYKNPEATKEVFTEDGWLRTGDVGHMDMNGSITITDRKKDMILVSGFNVYPNEVENVIASMPGVLEVGVVGVPSAKSGETVKAVIVRKDPALTADDVKKYCRTQLTGYKMPREIIFVDSLPKTAVGKILRRELKDIQ